MHIREWLDWTKHNLSSFFLSGDCRSFYLLFCQWTVRSPSCLLRGQTESLRWFWIRVRWVAKALISFVSIVVSFLGYRVYDWLDWFIQKNTQSGKLVTLFCLLLTQPTRPGLLLFINTVIFASCNSCILVRFCDCNTIAVKSFIILPLYLSIFILVGVHEIRKFYYVLVYGMHQRNKGMDVRPRMQWPSIPVYAMLLVHRRKTHALVSVHLRNNRQ